jgi:hypothetical protein
MPWVGSQDRRSASLSCLIQRLLGVLSKTVGLTPKGLGPFGPTLPTLSYDLSNRCFGEGLGLATVAFLDAERDLAAQVVELLLAHAVPGVEQVNGLDHEIAGRLVLASLDLAADQLLDIVREADAHR